MNDRNAPRLKKWPFFFADAVLIGLAFWILTHYPHPLAPWAGGLIASSVIVAAFLAVWPFRLEYAAEVKLFEGDRLTDATEGIRNLEDVSNRIREATGQWQGVQEHAGRTTQAAREIAERMTAEARAFSDFMTKANDSEKATLRLEVEKLRRVEGQWLQVLVHTLDHVHALYQAGSRSGQPNLAAQLATFQAACRDLARRVGLTAVDAEVDQDFDAAQHEVVQGQEQPVGSTQIAQVVAPGYSFQGQVLRRPIVVLKAEAEAEVEAEAEAEGSAADSADESSIGETPVETIGAPDDESTFVLAQLREAQSIQEEFIATTQSQDELLAEPGVPAVESGAPDLAEAPSEAASLEEFRLESEPPDADELRRRAGNG